MRILIVSQYFWPENFRINDLASELVKRGHDVSVLTGLPNYPAGKVFETFRKSPQKYESYHGCQIYRVPIFPRGSGSFRLLLNYVSYVVSACLIGGVKLRRAKFDIIFVYEPSPVTVCLPAIFIKAFKKIPIVFWVQDLWPETLEAIGIVKSQKLLRLIGVGVRYIYDRCDLILGQSQAFHAGISKYCHDEKKIRYYPNWSEDIFTEKKNETVTLISKFTDTFKVLFAGNMGDAQDFPAILNATLILKNEKVDAKIFIVGDGRAYDWVRSEITAKDLDDYVVLLGRHPLSAMPSFYASADSLLATLKDSPVFSMTIPSKIQSYMVAAKPILTMLTGEGSRLVDEAGCGFTAQSSDFRQLADNIKRMSKLDESALKMMGQSAKEYSDREFNRDKLITQLENLFDELIDQSVMGRKIG